MSTSTRIRAVNPFVERKIRAHAQGKPPALPVLHFALARAHVVDDLEEKRFEAGQDKIVPNVTDGPAHIGGLEVRSFLGVRAEAPDGQVRVRAPRSPVAQKSGH